MAELQNFRSAFNGFNREDVVNYIAYINNLHTSQLNQLQNQLHAAQQELCAIRNAPSKEEELAAQLEQAKAACAAQKEESARLSSQIAALEAAAEQAQAQMSAKDEIAASLQTQLEQALSAQRPQTQEELEAYRRAERAERIAHERVEAMYRQANGALGEATATVDSVCAQLGGISQQVMDQLAILQATIAQSKQALSQAVGNMYAVKPVSEE